MKGPRIDQHYDRLEPLERFRLAVAASARNDGVERDRLMASCPRESYSMPSVAVLHRLDLAEAFVIALIAELESVEARLRLLRGLRPFVECVLDRVVDNTSFALCCEVVPTEHHDAVLSAIENAASEPRIRLLTVFERIEADLLGHSAALVHGFAAFARSELGLQATTLIAAFADSKISRFEESLAAVPDSDAVAGVQQTFLELWRSSLAA